MNALLFPLILFALACCITPGPNNIMLTASGANFGFRRTIPHIIGIVAGVAVLMTLTGAGLGVIFSRFPQIQLVLKVIGAAYLLYLAWKIATIPALGTAKQEAKPFTFWQAVLFQFLNPKVMVMTFSAMTTFTVTGTDYVPSATRVVLVFTVICLPSVSCWAGFGVAIGRLLKNARTFRIFNISLGSVTALSVFFMI